MTLTLESLILNVCIVAIGCDEIKVVTKFLAKSSNPPQLSYSNLKTENSGSDFTVGVYTSSLRNVGVSSIFTMALQSSFYSENILA